MPLTEEQKKERRKESDKKYYEANKQKIKEQKKEYREANKEKIKEQKKEYHVKNKERIKEQKKEYREKNKEKIKEYNQTEDRKKSNKISDWKHKGVISNDYNALYEKYINTNECELCSISITSGKGITGKKHLDHCHVTGEFRNILCGVCNTTAMKNK
jgi:hypothetical protein